MAAGDEAWCSYAFGVVCAGCCSGAVKKCGYETGGVAELCDFAVIEGNPYEALACEVW